MRLGWLLVLALSVSANTQETKKAVPAAPPPPKVQKPVTRGEFFAVVGKLRSNTDRLIGLPVRSGAKPQRPSDPITRSEVILLFAELLDAYKPSFQSVPRPSRIDKAAIQQRNEPGVQAKLETLVKWGFVAPVGQLVVGPGKTLTADQAGDAIGFFWNQVTFLVTKVDPKWSPRLEPQGGG